MGKFLCSGILKIPGLLSVAKPCYVMPSSILNNNSVEKNINLQKDILFSFLEKNKPKKQQQTQLTLVI